MAIGRATLRREKKKAKQDGGGANGNDRSRRGAISATESARFVRAGQAVAVETAR